MNEDQLRALVREAIARHLPGGGGGTDLRSPEHPPTLSSHPSHFRYDLPQAGGPCLIEPAVPCNHCGYCQSHGY